MSAETHGTPPVDASSHMHVPALCRIFEGLSETELRTLILVVSSRAGFELPGATVSPAKLAFEAATLVANHGALDTELIRQLLELRPRRRNEIGALARAAEIPVPPEATANIAAETATTASAPTRRHPTPTPIGRPQHGRATLIYAALPIALLVAILLVSPERLPSYKLAMVVVSVALMTGFLSMYLTGQILAHLTEMPRAVRPAVEASGGLAVMVFVLAWWPGQALQALQAESTVVTPTPISDNSTKAGAKTITIPPVKVDGKKLETKSGSPVSEVSVTEKTVKPPKTPSFQRWTVKRVDGKTLALGDGALPRSGLLHLVPPNDARKFVSDVQCRVEEASSTCMLIQLPGNDPPKVGDKFEPVPKETP